MKIEVLGTGCAKCNALEAAAKRAAERLGLDYELTHVTQIAKFAAYGVMLTPALVVDGEVKVTGKVPSDDEIMEVLTTAASND